jgi:deoxycytidylate deaminase
VGSDISEVVYSFDYEEKDSLTEELFKEAGTRLRKFDLNLEKYIRILRKTYNKVRQSR